MKAPSLPLLWLIHEVGYKRIAGHDDFNKPTYDPKIVIKHVRFDTSTVFSRDSKQTKIVANGIIFVDVVNSTPIPEFVEESIIVWGGKDYVIKKIVPCYHPQINEIHHYELEVI